MGAGKALDPFSMKATLPESYYKQFKFLNQCICFLNILDMGTLMNIVNLLRNMDEDPGL